MPLVAKLNDKGTEYDCCHDTVIAAGFAAVLIDGLPTARLGDPLTSHDKPGYSYHPRKIHIGYYSFFLVCFFFASICTFPVFALDDSKQVILNEGVAYISKMESSAITIRKNASIYKNCKITNLQKNDTENGDGIINLTSDKKAIIFYSSGRYLLVDELLRCQNGNVTIHDSPDPKSAVNMLQDINFENNIYLSLSLEDKDLWSATVANFNSDKNLLSGDGFFNNSEATGYGFEIFGLGSGSISVDGKYVAPNGWGCAKDDIPGVWDIQQKKKVVFLSKNDNSDEIYNKCIKLFSGEATLKK